MIPLHETPIYALLKAEKQIEALQPIIDAFKPFIEYVTAIAKAMQRYDMSTGHPIRRPGMKPLLKNGRKP